MTPPIKRGTARRLGIHPPCPCMAVPQRLMLGASNVDLGESFGRSMRTRAGLVTVYREPVQTERHRCDGSCPYAAGRAR